MEELIRDRLLAQLSATAIDWGESIDGIVPPRVTLFRIGGGADYVAEGASGLNQARVQADCYGVTYAGAKALARSVRAAMSGWRSGNILGAFLNAERDMTPESGTGEVLARVSLDFIIHYKEF